MNIIITLSHIIRIVNIQDKIKTKQHKIKKKQIAIS